MIPEHSDSLARQYASGATTVASDISPAALRSARDPDWAAYRAQLKTRLHPLLGWLLPLALLLVWELTSRAGLLPSRILPEPAAVLESAIRLGQSGELWVHVKTSSWRALSGFALGGGAGLLLGILTGSSKRAELLLDTSIQMVRNVPPLALIPLVIIWFGIDEGAKLFLIAFGVFFAVYVNTYHGIRSVDSGLVEMGKSYGLRGWALYRDVIFPGALPSILVGVRYGLGLMWVILIVAETISAREGIGYMTMNAREFLQTDVVLLGILLYALLGKLADVAARLLEAVLVPWKNI